MGRFAGELARWLFDDTPPPSALGRVVVRVADRELHDARPLCRGRPLVAIEAAARATAALWPFLRDLPPPEESPPPPPDEVPVSGVHGALQSHLPEAGGAAVDAAIRTDRALRSLERLLPGLGWDLSPGDLERELLPRLVEIADLLRRHTDLQRIADALGRLEGASSRTRHELGGGEQVVGVHLSGRIQDALPGELALLGDPDTEDLFYQRWTEHRLLALELAGAGLDGAAAPERRGPVLLVVDTSGSMLGEPELHAKALVLAIARRVLADGRAAHLLLFGSRNELRELRLRRGPRGIDALLDLLAMRFGAGTDYDTPLRHALRLMQERDLHDADVVLITDGLASADDDVITAVQAARQGGARFLGALVGPASREGVEPLCDPIWAFHPDDPAAARPVLAHLRRGARPPIRSAPAR